MLQAVLRPVPSPISNARLQVILDGDHVLMASNATDFTIGVNHNITLRRMMNNAGDGDDGEGNAGKQFRGFLLRLGPPEEAEDGAVNLDTTDALDRTSDDVVVALEQCVLEEGVGGLSHTNNDLKDSVTGILRMDEMAKDLPLDVTVVIQNRNGISEYYYQRFFLNAVGGGSSVPAPAPVQLPAPAPFVVTPPSAQAPVLVNTKRTESTTEAKCGDSIGAAVARNQGLGGSAGRAKDCSRANGKQVLPDSFGGEGRGEGGGGRQRRTLKGRNY